MGTVGDAYDNGMAESFFASLEAELIGRHSGLGYLSPLNFERSQQARFNACKHDPSYADESSQMV